MNIISITISSALFIALVTAPSCCLYAEEMIEVNKMPIGSGINSKTKIYDAAAMKKGKLVNVPIEDMSSDQIFKALEGMTPDEGASVINDLIGKEKMLEMDAGSTREPLPIPVKMMSLDEINDLIDEIENSDSGSKVVPE